MDPGETCLKKNLDEILAHPIAQALNPKGKQFMTAHWLSAKLNPGAAYGIRAAALISFGMFPHIKTIPAFQMMLEDADMGVYDTITTIVVPSSGNTAHAVAQLAAAFGISEVKVFLKSDVPDKKKRILTALSSVSLFASPSHVQEKAAEEAQKPGHYLLNQYGHMGNVRAHELYTGPEVLRLCDGSIDAVAVSMGSAGTVTGISRAIKKINPRCIVIGVRPVLGQAIPGARDKAQMEAVVTLPYEDAVDAYVDVSRRDAFAHMRRLGREIEPQVGPTSAAAYRGLIQWFDRLKPSERERLKGKAIGFICADDARLYARAPRSVPQRNTVEKVPLPPLPW